MLHLRQRALHAEWRHDHQPYREPMTQDAGTAVRPAPQTNAQRQTAFVERMRASGRQRKAFWVTHDEERLIKSILDQHQASLALESECGMRIEPDGAYIEPSTLDNFTIREVSPKMASKMVQLWHSVLPNIPATNIQRNRHYACFALVLGGYAFAIAVYSSPVNRHLDDGHTLELRRLALSPKCPRNSATWFMARCERAITGKFPCIRLLVSYQDTNTHAGTIYKAGNWTEAAGVRYTPWKKTRTDRAPSQSKAKKVRWEKPLVAGLER